MGRGRVRAALEHRLATESAKRLGVEQPGLTITATVIGARRLYQGWERPCSTSPARAPARRRRG
jgi:hypothetical protein